MTISLRVQELIDKLATEGVRAAIDPALINPPAVLLVPPDLKWSVGCGVSVEFRAVCVAPSPSAFTLTTLDQLETLVAGLASVVDLEEATAVAYTLQGQTYAAFICKWQEVLD